MAHYIPSFLVLLVAVLLAIDGLGVSATPSPIPQVYGQPQCAKINKRQEWDALSREHKASYIKAVQCLQQKPGVHEHLYGIKRLTRFEDFIHRHKADGSLIHFVGHFLPWHRYFLYLWEKALKEECRYTGVQPYWNSTADVIGLRTEAMFADSAIGFGGDGIKMDVPPFPHISPPGTGGGCITTGPFKNLKLRIPRKNLVDPDPGHCLERNFNTWVLNEWNKPSDELSLLNFDSFWPFANELEGGSRNFTYMGMHGSGHAAIGGAMNDAWTSNSDPLFYLHHANIDRVWNRWQRANWAKRSTEIGGSTRPFTARLAPDYYSIVERNVTLDMELDLKLLGPVVTIGAMMDTTAWPLCYEYV